MKIRKTVSLSWKLLRHWLLRAYSSYYVFCIMLSICSLKLRFKSIVIPSDVTDEVDFIVISLVCYVCKAVFPWIIN